MQVGGGGGMLLDARQIPIEDIKIIVSRASTKNGNIILTNIQHIGAEDLKIIASRGNGTVIFDFVNQY